MQKLGIYLENCYGIKHLQTDFDFSTRRAAIVYAPNGAMKTSFARTFKDHSEGVDSKDIVYPDRITTRKITDQDGNTVPAEHVFVIEPYDSSYESDRVSTLLANSDLKEEYDRILKGIDQKCESLMKQLRKISGVRSDLENIISVTLSKRPDNLLRAFDRIKKEVYEDPEDPILSGIQYKTLFNSKIEKFLEDETIKSALAEYTSVYDVLLSQSRFFRKGVFNHYQASEIAKQLKTHGFFKADHKVFLNSKEGDRKVESEAELEALIKEELETILSDEQLNASFQRIDKKMTNQELRDFREFLLNNQTIIPRLQSPDALKEDLLKSYLMTHKTEFEELMEEYETGRKRIDEITKEASAQATKWQEVINIFNRRFSVPFTVGIGNKEDVILKRNTPSINFTFEDEASTPKMVERGDLIKILSSGECRALYILNIIFEVEARISDKIPTVFVIDDIADSFDYKNKYAIVEYLSDILSEGDFRQIILTHNYDFYRTVWRRLNLAGASFHISRSSSGITLTGEKMYRDPFQKWKAQGEGNGKQTDNTIVAMIPFVRNLADYCGHEEEFEKLTSLLHIKLNSANLTVRDLFDIYANVLNGQQFSIDCDKDTPVMQLALETARHIEESAEGILELEEKIVLSIAIRLIAEQIMIKMINDNEWVKTLNKYQTAKLINRFKEKFGDLNEHASLVALMDRVSLMTPENIHLNSFMYEPILDMSSEHLRKLYKEIVQMAKGPDGK